METFIIFSNISVAMQDCRPLGPPSPRIRHGTGVVSTIGKSDIFEQIINYSNVFFSDDTNAN